jgi:hypothetical protein
MHPLAQLQLELRQFALHLLPHCMPEHDELPVPVPSADVREAKEVEGRGLAVAPPLAIFGCKQAELDESGLLGVQFQIEAPKAFTQVLLELQGISAILETDNDVVGKTNDHHFPSSGLPPPLISPEVEHVMQIDIGKQG